MTRTVAYRILGLRPAATPVDVERAFRRLARAHHPDRGGDPERFRQLLAARATLTAPPAPAPLTVVGREPLWRRVLQALAVRLGPILSQPWRVVSTASFREERT